MKILGLAPDVWISSAALLEDGRVIAAASEERFDRQKMSTAFPTEGMDFCLRTAETKLAEIDRIVVPWNPGTHIKSASSRYTNLMRWRGEYLISVPGALLNNLGSPDVTHIDQVIHLEDNALNITFIPYED